MTDDAPDSRIRQMAGSGYKVLLLRTGELNTGEVHYLEGPKKGFNATVSLHSLKRVVGKDDD